LQNRIRRGSSSNSFTRSGDDDRNVAQLGNRHRQQARRLACAYGSLTRSDSLYNLCFPKQIAPAAVCQNGVMDRILHPVEPLAARVTVTATF
jgi:hypothetical protein